MLDLLVFLFCLYLKSHVSRLFHIQLDIVFICSERQNKLYGFIELDDVLIVNKPLITVFYNLFNFMIHFSFLFTLI